MSLNHKQNKTKELEESHGSRLWNVNAWKAGLSWLPSANSGIVTHEKHCAAGPVCPMSPRQGGSRDVLHWISPSVLPYWLISLDAKEFAHLWGSGVSTKWLRTVCSWQGIYRLAWKPACGPMPLAGSTAGIEPYLPCMVLLGQVPLAAFPSTCTRVPAPRPDKPPKEVTYAKWSTVLSGSLLFCHRIEG